MRRLRIAILCLACGAPMALAEPEGNRSGPGPGATNGAPAQRFNRDERMRVMRPPGEPTPEERAEFQRQLAEFCREHAPNRWGEIESRAEKNGRLPGGMFIGRFRNLQALKDENPELYDLKVKEIEVEDQEFGLLLDLKRAPGHREEIHAKLQAKSKELVELRLKERAKRIEQLAKMLEKEKQQLATDQRNMDRDVLKRFEGLKTEGLDFYSPKPRQEDKGPLFAPKKNDGGGPEKN